MTEQGDGDAGIEGYGRDPDCLGFSGLINSGHLFVVTE